MLRQLRVLCIRFAPLIATCHIFFAMLTFQWRALCKRTIVVGSSKRGGPHLLAVPVADKAKSGGLMWSDNKMPELFRGARESLPNHDGMVIWTDDIGLHICPRVRRSWDSFLCWASPEVWNWDNKWGADTGWCLWPTTYPLISSILDFYRVNNGEDKICDNLNIIALRFLKKKIKINNFIKSIKPSKTTKQNYLTNKLKKNLKYLKFTSNLEQNLESSYNWIHISWEMCLYFHLVSSIYLAQLN